MDGYRAELAQALAEQDPGATASESARSSVRSQLAAGVPAQAILDDAETRYDLDTVRAVRAEVGGYLMAQAGNNQSARGAAAQSRTAAEAQAGAVLARIGSGEEQDVAKLRISSATVISSAEAMANLAGQYAAKGELKPEDRLAMAYTQNDAERAQEGRGRVQTGPASPPATTRIGLSQRPGTDTASRRTPVPLRRRRAGRSRPIRW